MAKIKADELTPGMVCGEVIKGRGSLVLCQSGTVLTEQIIGFLKQWNVEEIEIFVNDNNKDADNFDGKEAINIDSAEFERVANEFFQHTDIEHPAMSVLYQEYITRLVTEKLMSK